MGEEFAGFGTIRQRSSAVESVLLCSNNEALGLKVLYCLREAGLHVDVVSVAHRNATRFSRYCRQFDQVDGVKDCAESRAQLAQWINSHADHRRWTAIVADDIHAHGLLHSLRDVVTVPSFAPSDGPTLTACHDKWSFYRRLKDANVSVPATYLLDDMDALTPEVLETVGFPLLVKPLNAESGHGIRRFDDYRSLIDYLKAPGPYKTLPLLLQRFITGHTLGLSLLATDGVIRCHDVQLHSDDGSRLFYCDSEVIEAGRRIVAAFDYGGPGHIDFVRDDESKRLYALEFNCRFWYSVTVSMWRGGNFPALAIDLALGRSIPASPTKPGAYFQPATVVKMLRRPRMLARLDEVNWRGFWQAVSDPIPHLLNRLL